MLFKKPPSAIEVYNDLNKDLVNLFMIMRDSYPEFAHRAEWSLHSREMFEDALRELKDMELSDMEKAMHYAVQKIQGFSGSGSSWGYGVTAKKVISGKWLPFLKKLELINARLKKVQIECLDFERLIKKYDTETSLFYLDPPYVDVESYYNHPGVAFKREEHHRLNALLRTIKGRFVLSYYEHPLVRELYSDFRIITKQTVKSSAGCVGAKRIGYVKPKSIELLITNY